MKETSLRITDVAAFSSARNAAHLAVQHLARAARANLPAASDDSHSNLGWDNARQGFLSHAINGAHIGLSLAPMTLTIIEKSGAETAFAFNGVSDAEAAKWLDVQLQRLQLKGASAVALPYELPADAAERNTYPSDTDSVAFHQLAGWYSLAHNVLSSLARKQSGLTPGPSPVRCWPHHFDIATYVSLEEGDPETARGIGVGLSPGDEGYDEPYFYINPWPHSGRREFTRRAAARPLAYRRLCRANRKWRRGLTSTAENFVLNAFKTALKAQSEKRAVLNCPIFMFKLLLAKPDDQQ